MTKVLISISVLLCAILFSCKSESKSSDIPTSTIGDTLPLMADEDVTWRFDTLSVDKKVHIDDDTKKQAMSIWVYLTYPISSPAKANLGAIQKTIAELLDKKHSSATIKESFENLVKHHIDDAHTYGKEWEAEYSEYIKFSNYEQQTSTSVEYVSPDIITLSTTQSSYLGGAHGSYYIKYNNISTEDGSLITEELLFKEEYKEKLAQFIQAEVDRRNLSENEDEHIILLVETNELMPNANFYFDKRDIVYVYNQYEIAPYVQGVIEIRIPISKIANLINSKYLPMLDVIPQEV